MHQPITKTDGMCIGVLDIKATVAAFGDKCKGLLGMHRLSGSDKVSYPNVRGNVSVQQVLIQMDVDELDSWGGQCYPDRPADNEHCFLLSPYCHK